MGDRLGWGLNDEVRLPKTSHVELIGGPRLWPDSSSGHVNESVD